MLVEFPPSGCRFGPLDSRSGSRQFLIGEIDQIHKLDRVSEVTSVWFFRQGCLHHEGSSFQSSYSKAALTDIPLIFLVARTAEVRRAFCPPSSADRQFLERGSTEAQRRRLGDL